MRYLYESRKGQYQQRVRSKTPAEAEAVELTDNPVSVSRCHVVVDARTADPERLCDRYLVLTGSGEIAGDFMFWPTGKHRFGWYLEPAYDYSFAGGHQQSIGMSAGLLIGIR
jgi:hypothetical protein